MSSGGTATQNGLIVYSSAAAGTIYANLIVQNNGDTSIRGAINANGDALNFTNTLNRFKINLWASGHCPRLCHEQTLGIRD